MAKVILIQINGVVLTSSECQRVTEPRGAHLLRAGREVEIEKEVWGGGWRLGMGLKPQDPNVSWGLRDPGPFW